MAMQYKVTRTEVKERYFTCDRCGAKGEVEFHAVGDGGWVKESYWQPNAAGRSAEQAETDLAVDADRVVGYIRCPACELRPKGAFAGAGIRIGIPTVIGAVAPLLDKDLIWYSLVFWAFALWLAYRELQRVRRADRAEVLKLEYPIGGLRLPLSPRGVKAAAKAAAVLAAMPPSPKPVVPVVPVKTSAPEIVQPRGAEDGPAFLKGD